MNAYVIVSYNSYGYQMFGIYSDFNKAMKIADKLTESDYIKNNNLIVTVSSGTIDDDSSIERVIDYNNDIAMKTSREMAEVMLAYADGKKIEYYEYGSQSFWKDVDDDNAPCVDKNSSIIWDWNKFDFRIKS